MIPKNFVVSFKATPGYGSCLFLPGISTEEWIELIQKKEEFEHEWVQTILSSLSSWGGCTSNSPDRYRIYEFPSSARLFQAIDFLKAHGYTQVPQLPKKEIEEAC